MGFLPAGLRRRSVRTYAVVPAASANGRKPYLRCRHDSGPSGQTREQVAIDHREALFAVLRPPEIETDGEHALGLEAGVGRKQVPEAADEQQGAD